MEERLPRAAEWGDVEESGRLVGAGANVNATDDAGVNAHHIAAGLNTGECIGFACSSAAPICTRPPPAATLRSDFADDEAVEVTNSLPRDRNNAPR